MKVDAVEIAKNACNVLVAEPVEHLVFGGRWMLAPMYLGLVVAISLYTYRFVLALYSLCLALPTIQEEALMLGVLNLVDITMVGNLIVMIMIGGWHIFVRTLNYQNRPQWLLRIDSGVLKIKMGMSLIGVSSIHLLKAFINAEHSPWEVLAKLITIHLVFVLSTLVLAYIYTLQHPSGETNEKAH